MTFVCVYAIDEQGIEITFRGQSISFFVVRKIFILSYFSPSNPHPSINFLSHPHFQSFQNPPYLTSTSEGPLRRHVPLASTSLDIDIICNTTSGINMSFKNLFLHRRWRRRSRRWRCCSRTSQFWWRSPRDCLGYSIVVELLTTAWIGLGSPNNRSS